MKKQIIPNKSGLNLSKRTISNLDATLMNEKVGGKTNTCATCKGNTCNNHNGCSAKTCVTCYYTCGFCTV